MVSVTVKISGPDASSVVSGILCVQGKYPDLHVETIAESQQKLLAVNTPAVVRRRRALGSSRSAPGKRIMDYVLKAMQSKPASHEWAYPELAKACIDLGCQTSKAKLESGLHPCLSTMRIKLGLVERTGNGTVKLSKSGTTCAFPVPYTMSGERL